MENILQPLPPFSIIIPVFNEDKNIVPLVNSIEYHLGNQEYELILVNDGSTDKTKEELNKLQNHLIKIIHLDSNYGQSAAIKAGVDFSRYDILVLMDGDLQNDPKDISSLLKKLINNKLSLVQGYRKVRFDSPTKKIPSYFANLLFRLVFKYSIHDIGCALKIVQKEALSSINYFDGFHRYLALLVFLNNSKIEEVIVSHHPRKNGLSKYGMGRFKKVIKHLIDIKTGKYKKYTSINYTILE